MGNKFCRCKNQEVGEVEVYPEQLGDIGMLHNSEKKGENYENKTPSPTSNEKQRSKIDEKNKSELSLRNCKDSIKLKNEEEG